MLFLRLGYMVKSIELNKEQIIAACQLYVSIYFSAEPVENVPAVTFNYALDDDVPCLETILVHVEE